MKVVITFDLGLKVKKNIQILTMDVGKFPSPKDIYLVNCPFKQGYLKIPFKIL